MDRHTRQELKTDPFAEGVGHSFEFLSTHRPQVIRYGILGVVVILAVVGIWMYRSHQASVRQEALAQALQIEDAVVSPTPQPPKKNFATQDEKDKARMAAYADVASKYSCSREAAIAQLYLAGIQLDKGKLDEAEKIYKTIVDSAPDEYAAVAKLSLAEIYGGEGKTAEAEKLLRPMTQKSSTFVSKEEAALTLGKMLAKSNPEEAKKLLDPLKSSTRAPISTAAVSELAKLGPSKNN